MRSAWSCSLRWWQARRLRLLGAAGRWRWLAALLQRAVADPAAGVHAIHWGRQHKVHRVAGLQLAGSWRARLTLRTLGALDAEHACGSIYYCGLSGCTDQCYVLQVARILVVGSQAT